MISVDTFLACALKSRRSFSSLRRAVTNDLAVADPFLLDLMRAAAEHVDRYGDVPTEKDMYLWLEGQPEGKREALRAKYRELIKIDLSGYTEEYLAEQAGTVFKEAAAQTAVRRLAAMADRQELTAEATLAVTSSLQDIRPVHLDGLMNLAELDKYLIPNREETNRIETGIEKLDAVLGGGFERELVFLMAATGIGKTTFLVNRLVNAALRGAHCLHITLELSGLKTLHRYYRRIAAAERGEFFENPEGVEGRVRHWLRFAQGSVHVLYLPAFSATVDEIKATAEIFRDMHGGLDVLALDYLDLLATSTAGRGLRRYDQLGILSHEIRTICTTMEAEVITASQANREGMDAAELTLKHMAGAIAKAEAADVVLGLVQNKDELAMRQARMGLLKMRDYPGRGAEIPLHYDGDHMTIMDLDHPTARKRREEMEEIWAAEENQRHQE